MECEIENGSINILLFQGKIKVRVYKLAIVLTGPKIIIIGYEI